MSDTPKIVNFEPNRNKTPGELAFMVPGVLNAETIDSLRQRKLLREHTEQIELDMVNPGERHLGYLNPEERLLYVEMVLLNADLDDMAKEQQARCHEMVAAAIRKTAPGKNFMRNLDERTMFPTKEDAEEYFGLHTRVEYLRAIYNNSVRERFGHSVILGVRTDYAVVAVRSKYEIPSELIEQLGE